MSDTEENLTPDTDTGDEIERLPPADESDVAQAVPVAPPVDTDAEPASEEPPPPPPPSGPRIFPQQYTMLFANTFILVGCLTVWERAAITGRDLYGFQSIGGSIVMAFAAYSVLAGIVGLIRGGVNFFATLGTGFFALYFAIKVMLRTIDHDNFLPYGNLNEQLGGAQQAINALLSEFGPGLYLCLFGGAIILVMFFKAMFGGKKKAPEPAPTRRRGRR